MKSPVLKGLTLLLTLSALTPLAIAQCKCTCRPSPPGATIHCESGQIAICSDNGRGVCEGSCFDTHSSRDYHDWASNNEELDFTAYFLSKLFNQRISTGDLRLDRRNVAQIIDRIIYSSRYEDSVTIAYKETRVKVSVGLTNTAERTLRNAQGRLHGVY